MSGTREVSLAVLLYAGLLLASFVFLDGVFSPQRIALAVLSGVGVIGASLRVIWPPTGTVPGLIFTGGMTAVGGFLVGRRVWYVMSTQLLGLPGIGKGTPLWSSQDSTESFSFGSVNILELLGTHPTEMDVATTSIRPCGKSWRRW